METTDRRQPSPWQPTTDLKELAILGKLLEELGECAAAASRCIIQGVCESEPVTGKANIAWLAEELADVQAGIVLAKELLTLDEGYFLKRVERKLEHLRGWHELIEKGNSNG
jgi:NTP pyrophosphatase (non-canonical NTP hydrolase)